MKYLLIIIWAFVTVVDATAAEKQPDQSTTAKQGSTVMPFTQTMKMLDGKDVTLNERYKDKVVLVVNVASKCGLTPQYKGLQKLFDEKKGQGFAIAAFPCNQFGKQEPGTAEEIQSFCQKNYGVTFDVFAKIEVNGEGACALYKQLTALDLKPAGTGKIAWNFEKFLVAKDGSIIARFGPRTEPDDKALLAAIVKALQ